VEFLETRCLMAGGHAAFARHIESRMYIPGPTLAAQRIASHIVHHAHVRHPRPTADKNAMPVVGYQDRSSEYTDLTSAPSSPPSLPGLPKDPYQVVFETKSPHQSLANAQALPRVPFFGVVGTIAPGDPIDLYRMILPAGVKNLDFALVSDQPASSVPMQLQLFDASGQFLRSWSVGDPMTSPLSADLSGLPANSSVYLGITAGSLSWQAGPSPTVNYQLWISLRESSESASTIALAGAAVPTSALMPLFASSLTASANPPGQPSTGASQAVPTQVAPSGAPDGSRVAVGSPAVRWARPSGGLLSDGEATPPAARDFNASVNKEWDERSPTGPAVREAIAAKPTALAGTDNDPDALVVIAGPSGFPLVGAVAIGHRRNSPAMLVGEFVTTPALERGDPAIESRFAIQAVLPSHEILVAARPDPDQSRTLTAATWNDFPAPVFSGLGLATVFTLNAVLSQPIAGFDYLTSRLDAVGRPLADRNDQRQRKSAAPHRS
jgi:hypothetical protein